LTHEDPLAALRRLPTPEARAGLHDQIKAQARGPLRRRRARRRVGRLYGDVELALAAAMALLYLGWAAQAVTMLHSLSRPRSRPPSASSRARRRGGVLDEAHGLLGHDVGIGGPILTRAAEQPHHQRLEGGGHRRGAPGGGGRRLGHDP